MMSDGRLPTGPVAIKLGGMIAVELIPLFVRKDGNSNGHEHRRDDQHQDSATQALDNAGTGRGSLGVTQGASLSVTSCGGQQDWHREEGAYCESTQGGYPRFAHCCTPYFEK